MISWRRGGKLKTVQFLSESDESQIDCGTRWSLLDVLYSSSATKDDSESVPGPSQQLGGGSPSPSLDQGITFIVGIVVSSNNALLSAYHLPKTAIVRGYSSTRTLRTPAFAPTPFLSAWSSVYPPHKKHRTKHGKTSNEKSP